MKGLASDPQLIQAAANAQASAELVALVVDQGVSHAILSPGSRNTPLALAFAQNPNVEIKVVLDERSAGFFALGVSRASGQPVALVCTSGSALANYYPAVVEAYHSEIPLILLTADRPSELQNRGAPQTMRQKQFFGSFAKISVSLDAPQSGVHFDNQTALRRTLQAAVQSPKGPVHINCGFRKPLWDSRIEQPTLTRRDPAPSSPVADAQADLVDGFMTALLEAKKGVFICGPDAFPHNADASALYDLAGRLKWPVLAEASSGARFGHNHPALITHYDAALRVPDAIPSPDCIVRFGRACTSQPLANWIKRSDKANWLVVHDGQTCIDPERPHDHSYTVAPDRLLNAVESQILTELCADPSWLELWTEMEKACHETIAAFEQEALWEGSVASTCVRNQSDRSTIHVANSMPIRDLDGFGGRSESAITVYVNRGLNGIDGTIATALGEQFGRPDHPLLLLIGDLAFRHDANSLALCKDRKITIVVNDNGGGQIFRFLPISENKEVFEELFLTPSNIEIESLCQGYGLRCTVVETCRELETALRREQVELDTGVVLARIDPEINYNLHQSVWRRVQTELGGHPS